MKLHNNLFRIVVLWFLTLLCVCADQSNDVNFVQSYDTEETLTDDRVPLVPDDETPGDQPGVNSRNSGHVRFEDEPPGPSGLPVKFEDKPDDDQVDDGSTIIENGPNYTNENNLIITVDENVDYEDNNHKIRFEESHKHSEKEPSDSTETYDVNESERNTGQVSFDETKLSDSKSNLEDIEYENEDTPNLNNDQDLVKYEHNNDESERVVFEDNQKVKEPVRYKKRPVKRKPRVQFKEGASQTPNAVFSGFRNPNYPGVNAGYSNPGYQSAYPKRYPPPSSPGGFPYPTQSPYPAYPNYLNQHGLGHNPGYGLYSGHQAPQQIYPQENLEPSKYAAEKYPASGPARPVTYPEQEYTGTGYPNYGSQGGYPGYAPPTGPSGSGGYGLADGNSQYGQYRPRPDYPGAPRPFRRQKSLPERAVSAVAEALTSIALFDDKQCVPRLLCEVASGSTSTSPTLLKATAGLSPLLTVLQAYNGVSSSPLFLFGRAAVLGMTSKGNPTSCRYAYSQCPNSPDALLDYLNNHNGGFFRFFGQPEPNKQQNLEQFYNHLAGQYGYLQQPQAQVNQQQSNSQQRPYRKPGHPQQQPDYPQQRPDYSQQQSGYPQPQQGYPQQQPGYLQPQPGYTQQQGYPSQQSYQQQQTYPQSNYPQQQGNPPQQSYPYNPYSNSYGSQSAYPQNYGPNYLYAYKNAIEADSDTEADFSDTEERIQNKPGVQALEEEGEEQEEEKEESGSKWAFPDEANAYKKESKRKQRKLKPIRPKPQNIRDERGASKLKFPDESGSSENNFYVNRENDFIRAQKSIYFPAQNYFNVQASYQTAPAVNLEEFVFDQKHNFYVKRPKLVNDNADFVYIVRGNGDPNHPEVIQVRPGQNTY